MILKIKNLTGAVVTTHLGYQVNQTTPINLFRETDGLDNSKFYDYPTNFLCEIIVQVPSNSRIMLRIASFYIPAHNSLCDDNYLYVFDYKSSLSKAMDVAGGENGLCNRNYPNFPIFTTGPFITLVFKSTLRNKQFHRNPGFQLFLTEIKTLNDNENCVQNYYKCGPIEHTQLPIIVSSKWRVKRRNSNGKSQVLVTPARQIVTQARAQQQSATLNNNEKPIVRYCISQHLLCDWKNNCHDGYDENEIAFKLCLRDNKIINYNQPNSINSGILTRFLSLGLSAAIAIAVSMIIAITFCVAVTVCSFMRLCTAGSLRTSRSQPRFTKGVFTPATPNYLSSTTTTTATESNPLSTYSPNNNHHHHHHHSHHPHHSQQNPSSQFGCFRGTSPPASSMNSDKLYQRMYGTDTTSSGQHNCSHGYGAARPSSEKLGHWASSSIASYPSSADGHHSHPETPYFKRESNYYDQSMILSNSPQKQPQQPHLMEIPHPVTAPNRSVNNVNTNCNNNNNNIQNNNSTNSAVPLISNNNQQFIIQTPSSSRSAKSTRSTKSSNLIDKKHRPIIAVNQTASGQQDRIRMLGPVLGEV